MPHPKTADVVHNRAAIDAIIAQQATLINAHYRCERALVLPVMTGALIYAGQLLPRLTIELELDYVHATRYDGARAGGRLNWLMRPRSPVAGRKILLLDDILDEGLTLALVRDWLLEQGAAEVLISVLAHKLKAQPQACSADFPALPVPDCYVYGFGLDVDGLWRNADGIFVAPGVSYGL